MITEKFYLKRKLRGNEIFFFCFSIFWTGLLYEDQSYSSAIIMSFVTIALVVNIFYKLFDHRAYLTLDANGLFYRGFKFGTIIWSDIDSITPNNKNFPDSKVPNYTGWFKIILLNKNSYLSKVPIMFEINPECRKEPLELDLNNLHRANANEIIKILKIYLPENKIHDQEWNKRLKLEAKKVALEYGRSYIVAGKIYASVDDMPDDVRKDYDMGEKIKQATNYKTNR